MKKKLNLMGLGFNNAYIRKILTVMRITVLLCLLGVLQVAAANTYSQEALISLDVREKPVSDVLRDIEEQSEFFFLYNNKLIDVDRLVDIEVDNNTITKVLDILFDDSIDRNIDDKLIVLSSIGQKNQGKSQDESLRKGTVLSSDDGLGLPGVSVVIKGTTTGTSTDIDGAFSIKANKGDILIFSFMGMVPQEFTVVNNESIAISLMSDALQMEEVVVVGYGVQRKDDLTGSISSVASDRITSATETSVDKALQGNTAGVVTTSANGIPGSFAKVIIRGSGSINAGTDPLYIVDGMPVVTESISTWSISSNALSSINPNDIESMTVLKDAAATAIYGSRASNGVVIITTKSGKSGKAKLNFSIENGFSEAIESNLEMCNSEELLMLQREAVDNAREHYKNDWYTWQQTDPNGSLYMPDELADTNTNWFDAITRKGKYQSYNLSASGGNEKTKFFLSGSWMKQEGIVVGTGFQRFSGRANVNHKYNDKLTFGSNTSVSSSEQDYCTDGWAYENPVSASFSISPAYSPYKEDGTFNVDLGNTNGNYNPLQIAEYNQRGNKVISIINSTFVDYKILPSLTFKTTFGVDWKNTDERVLLDPRTPSGADKNGSVQSQNLRFFKWVSSNTLNYNKVLFDKHSIDVLVGYEAQAYKSSWLYAYGQGVTTDIPSLASASDKFAVAEGANEISSNSIFSRLFYSYDSRYYMTASVRRDASSVFGTNHKYGNFWSVSGGWKLSEEEFLQKDWIDNLKLRASYGTTGNSSIGAYDSKGLYETSKYNKEGGLTPKQLENDNLKWETSATTNVGLDFSFFGRVSGSADYFWKKTTDLLLKKQISTTSGFSSIMSNVGSLMNKGFEFQLSTRNLKGDGLNWSTDFNISFPKSEVLDLGGEDMINYDYARRRRVGHSMLEWYMYDYAGVNPDNGLSQYRNEAGDLTTNPNEARRVFAGSPEPDYYGGITNNFSYKGFDLSFMFYFL